MRCQRYQSLRRPDSDPTSGLNLILLTATDRTPTRLTQPYLTAIELTSIDLTSTYSPIHFLRSL